MVDKMKRYWPKSDFHKPLNAYLGSKGKRKSLLLPLLLLLECQWLTMVGLLTISSIYGHLRKERRRGNKKKSV